MQARQSHGAASAAPMIPPEAPNRERLAWALNDVANSAYALVMVTAVYALYFSNVVVGADQPGRGDRLWGNALAASMAVVALTSPVLGALADRRGWRKHLLFAYTLVGVTGTAACALVGPGEVALGLACIFLANVAFEGSLVFYDALLPGLVRPTAIGRWSGIGWSMGYLGGLACLLLALPLAEAGQVRLVFLVVAAWWLAFSLPLFFLVRDRAPRLEQRAGDVFAQVGAAFRRIRGNRDLFRFFIAYFLYNDGVATTVSFAALYASKTLRMETGEIMAMLAAVQLSGAVGAFGLGFVADRIGHARTLVLTLCVWCLVILGAFWVTEKDTFWWLALAVGFVMGATQSASRGLLASVVPPAEAGELFGFKAIAGKFSAVAGPLIFGFVSEATGSQRYALLAVGGLFVAGLLLMLGVDERRARAHFAPPPAP